MSEFVNVLAIICLCSIFVLASAGSAFIDLHRENSKLDSDATRSAQNVVYYGEFSMGTPAKQFTGCFDTGSSDTWLPSVACFDPACTSHDRFNPARSSTFQSSAQSSGAGTSIFQRTQSWGPFMVTYGTGQVAGTVAADTLQLGNITVDHQGFGLVLQASTDFLDISCDGLFGLGFPSISNLQTTPAFFNMLDDGELDQPLFAMYLNPDIAMDPSGELSFGAVNPSKYVGKITYSPVTEEKYWTVALSGVSVSGQSITVAATSVVIDSGTSAILMGPDDCAAIHKAIPGVQMDTSSGYYTVVGGCKNVASLPAITFQIGGTDYAMPPEIWTRPAASEYSTDMSGQCVSVLIGSGLSSNTILGAPFLRAFYSVYTYDMSSKVAQIGFAKAAASS